MGDLILSFANLLKSVFGFIVSTIKSFISLISQITSFAGWFPTLIAYLPLFLQVFVLAGIAASIIFLLVGRNT